MSKNFELLQQIGNDEELFRTSGHPKGALATADVESTVDLDNEGREQILQKSSLPDVFRNPSESAANIMISSPELNPTTDERTKQGAVDNGPSSNVFRTSRNPTSPIGRVLSAPSLEQGRAATWEVPQSDSSAEAHRPTRRTKSFPAAAISGSPSDLDSRAHEKALQRTSFGSQLVDSIKASARNWKWEVPPRNSHRGVDLDLEAIIREEEMKLVQRVFPAADHGSARVAVFASLENEAGCASICARSGQMLAVRAEGPVCIIDADFHSPSLHEYFGVENSNGLAEATIGSDPIQNFAHQLPVSNLWLVPSGKTAPQVRFSAIANRLRARIAELRAAFSYVVIHAGPLCLDTNSMLLSQWTDGVVLVVEANSTHRETARRVKENLQAANVSVLGVVLNNRTFPIPEALYRKL